MRILSEVLIAVSATVLFTVIIFSVMAGVFDGTRGINYKGCDSNVRIAKYNPIYQGTCGAMEYLTSPTGD